MRAALETNIMAYAEGVGDFDRISANELCKQAGLTPKF
jgi:hypothetical protein